MTDKRIHFAVETALSKIPKEQWPTSVDLYREMERCPRLKGIIRNHVRARGVSLDCVSDISAEVIAILQIKMMPILDSPQSFYFVAFRVAHLVVLNYGRKSYNTFFSQEVSINGDFASPGNSDESDEMAERCVAQLQVQDFSNDSIDRVDRELAQNRLRKKLAANGWPEDIQRERTRIGRPKKENPTRAPQREGN